jgi:protein-tyrosine phosphatase
MAVYWVGSERSLRLAIVPRPRGGDWLEDDLRALRREGLDILVSMLTSPETEELGLARESLACKEAGIEYLSFPIPDRQVPESYGEMRRLVARLRPEIESGKSVGVHCRAGIGRSSLMLASILCAVGLSAEAAFGMISKSRGLVVPDTAEQVRWVEAFAAFLAR